MYKNTNWCPAFQGSRLSNLSTGAASLLTQWALPLPIRRAPLEFCLSSSFLLSLYPNLWKRG